MMKRFWLLFCVAALLAVCLPALAAGNTAAFDRNANLVFEGETLQTVLNLDGDPATGTVTYTSANTKRATVDENGVVTGIQKGQVTITATIQTAKRTYRAQLTVNVARKAAQVEVNPQNLTVLEADDPRVSELLTAEAPEGEEPEAEAEQLPVLLLPLGRTYSLRVNILPTDANNRRSVLTSSDESVVRVKGTSLTAQKLGEAELTVANEWSPEVNVRYHVLVVQPVTKLKLTAEGDTVPAGSTLALTPVFTPESASVKAVSWKSANEKIATVDENGVVTGVTRGNARITATTLDGTRVSANYTVKVTQTATSITLNQTEFTIDVGRYQSLRATVLPANTNDKSVEWESTDPTVATVNQYGRVTGVGVGTCEIVCTSKEVNDVSASATVHVQQPVTKVSFTASTLEVYVGETGTVQWVVEPSNATNPAVTLSSSNTKIITVSEDGTVTPVRRGEAYVYAASTDGSNRRARITVKVLQHVEGVHMESDTCYINVEETATARAILEPKDASNNRMTWESDDRKIARVSGNRNRPEVTGISWGETVIRGTSEDGGFTTSFVVKVGDWDHALGLSEAYVDTNGKIRLLVRNNSNLTITRVNVAVEVYDDKGDPIAVNTADSSNVFTAVYKDTLEPGDASAHGRWYFADFREPAEMGSITVQIVSYVIDGTWTKTIQEENRPTLTYTVY